MLLPIASEVLLVECGLGKADVTGSIPVGSSRVRLDKIGGLCYS